MSDLAFSGLGARYLLRLAVFRCLTMTAAENTDRHNGKITIIVGSSGTVGVVANKTEVSGTVTVTGALQLLTLPRTS